MQKHVNLVDLVKSFPTHILLQNLASIQQRTSPLKYAHLAKKSEKGSISNLSTKVASHGSCTWVGASSGSDTWCNNNCHSLSGYGAPCTSNFCLCTGFSSPTPPPTPPPTHAPLDDTNIQQYVLDKHNGYPLKMLKNIDSSSQNVELM